MPKRKSSSDNGVGLMIIIVILGVALIKAFDIQLTVSNFKLLGLAGISIFIGIFVFFGAQSKKIMMRIIIKHLIQNLNQSKITILQQIIIKQMIDIMHQIHMMQQKIIDTEIKVMETTIIIMMKVIDGKKKPA